MQQTDTISIALATCNGAGYIEEQLASLLAQTRLPYEIVVSDDRSDDDTLARIESIAANSPVPIRILRNQQRLGYGDNFLHAAAHTTGRWIAFCDQDDIWLPNKLERCAQLFAEPGVLAVVHNAHLMYGSQRTDVFAMSEINRSCVVEPLTEDAFRTYLGFAMIFRRELIDQIDFERRPINQNNVAFKLPHDDWIAFLALALGKVALVHEALVLYRRHPDVVTRPAAPLLTRARLAMTRYESGLEEMATAADERADFLEGVSLELVPAQRVVDAVARYREVARLTRQRQGLAALPSVARRAHSLWALARGPDYGGRRAFMKDLFFGTLHLDRIYGALRVSDRS